MQAACSIYTNINGLSQLCSPKTRRTRSADEWLNERAPGTYLFVRVRDLCLFATKLEDGAADYFRNDWRYFGLIVAVAQFGRDAVDIFDQADTFEGPDDITRQVELIPFQTVESRTWEGVMVVVPAFAECQQANDPFVAALVRGFVVAFAKSVADRVDTP